jgi:hypothetical protein
LKILREVVQPRYSQAVKAEVKGAKTSCCGSSASAAPMKDQDLGGGTDPIPRDLYSSEEAAAGTGLLDEKEWNG